MRRLVSGCAGVTSECQAAVCCACGLLWPLLADVAGLHWSSCPEGVCGLEVRMDGFSHKLHVLATRVFKALAGAQVWLGVGRAAAKCLHTPVFILCWAKCRPRGMD